MLAAYKEMFKRWGDFSGRSNRRTFWLTFLMNMIIGFVFYAVLGVLFLAAAGLQPSDGGTSTGQGILFVLTGLVGLIFGIYSLVAVVPGLALAIRRLHDTGRSGWFVLISLVPIVGSIALLVYYATEGDKGPNAYGMPDGSGAQAFPGYSGGQGYPAGEGYPAGQAVPGAYSHPGGTEVRPPAPWPGQGAAPSTEFGPRSTPGTPEQPYSDPPRY